VFRKVQVTQAHPGGTLEAVAAAAAAAEEEDSREQTSQTETPAMFKNVQLEHAHAILKAVSDLTAGKRAAAFFNGEKQKNTGQSKLLHSRRRQVVLAIGVGAKCCCRCFCLPATCVGDDTCLKLLGACCTKLLRPS
jgi:hypothetical protein